MQQRSPAFFALIALGVILLVAGIVYGLGSRHVQYKNVAQGSIAHYLSSDGTGYLQMEGNSSLYIVHQDNFTPKLPTFADSDTVSFTYDPGETTSVDVKSTIGTHLVGTASKVVAITSSDTTGQKTYATPEYVSNSQGYDNNQWPLGFGLLVIGLLFISGSFFLPKKKLSAVITPSFANTPIKQPQFPQIQRGTPPYGQQPLQGFPTSYPTAQPNFQPQPQPGLFQQTPPGYSQQQPNTSGQTQQPANPFGQQPPNPFGQPQPQQSGPLAQPQPQQSGPLLQPQPQKPPVPQSQFLRPGSFQPPQQ